MQHIKAASCNNLQQFTCFYHFFLLAMCEWIVTWSEKWDLHHLFWSPTQACTEFVQIVYCCWTVDFVAEDLDFPWQSKEYDFMHILKCLVSVALSASLTESIISYGYFRNEIRKQKLWSNTSQKFHRAPLKHQHLFHWDRQTALFLICKTPQLLYICSMSNTDINWDIYNSHSVS